MTYKINRCCHKPTKMQLNYSTNLLFLLFCVIRIFLHHIHVLSVDLFTPVFIVWAPFAFSYLYFKNLNANNALLLCHIYFPPKNSSLVAPE
jgi:hypothetical protein